jgi:hypothetical protein
MGLCNKNREWRDFESEKLEKRISREASLEASLKGGEGLTSGCTTKEEKEIKEGYINIEVFTEELLCPKFQLNSCGILTVCCNIIGKNMT